MARENPKLTPESSDDQAWPVRSYSWLSALLVLAVYALTMSRDLSLFDSPELALVAFELGLGHPPGQPLHTLLAHVFAHLPGVAPLLGLNLLSALAGSLTVVPAARMAERFSGGVTSRGQEALLAAVVGYGALLPILWEPATRVEVYSLATLLSVWGLERVQTALQRPAPTTAAIDPLVVGALLIGLSASVNPVTALCCTVTVTPAVLHAVIQRRVTLRAFGASLIAGIVGLLPYLYVPLVSGRTDALVWGAPTDASALLNFLTGSDYGRNTGITFAAWTEHLSEWLGASYKRFSLVWLVLGVLAAFVTPGGRLLGRAQPLALLSLCIALVCANAIFRVDNPDYHGYLAAPMWLCVAGVAAFTLVSTRRARWRGALTLTLCLLVGSWPFTSSRADDRLVRDLVQTALQRAPKNAIVVIESDHWIAPALYLQRVEKLRPDVVVLGAGLASSSWYWNLLFRAHPELRAFELRGPGGRDTRVQRFLRAQPPRPILLENAGLAMRLQLQPCVDAPLLSTAPCNPNLDGAHDHARRLAAQLAAHRDVPLAREFIATLALEHGEDLWRLGAENAALHTLLSGVPFELRAEVAIDWNALRSAPRLLRPPVQWQRQTVLGEPARNLYVAAELLFIAGQTDAAQALAVEAARLGLPEATH